MFQPRFNGRLFWGSAHVRLAANQTLTRTSSPSRRGSKAAMQYCQALPEGSGELVHGLQTSWRSVRRRSMLSIVGALLDIVELLDQRQHLGSLLRHECLSRARRASDHLTLRLRLSGTGPKPIPIRKTAPFSLHTVLIQYFCSLEVQMKTPGTLESIIVRRILLSTFFSRQPDLAIKSFPKHRVLPSISMMLPLGSILTIVPSVPWANSTLPWGGGGPGPNRSPSTESSWGRLDDSMTAREMPEYPKNDASNRTVNNVQIKPTTRGFIFVP